MNHDNPFGVFEQRSEATSCPTGEATLCETNPLQEIRFGARVVLKGNMQAKEWTFLQWNETHDQVWLCHPREGELARRGPIQMMFSPDRIESFANVERYEPTRKV